MQMGRKKFKHVCIHRASNNDDSQLVLAEMSPVCPVEKFAISTYSWVKCIHCQICRAYLFSPTLSLSLSSHFMRIGLVRQRKPDKCVCGAVQKAFSYRMLEIMSEVIEIQSL